MNKIDKRTTSKYATKKAEKRWRVGNLFAGNYKDCFKFAMRKFPFSDISRMITRRGNETNS